MIENLPLILSMGVVAFILFIYFTYQKSLKEKEIKLSDVFLTKEELQLRDLQDKEKSRAKGFIEQKKEMLVQSKTNISLGMYAGIAVISMSLIFFFLEIVFKNPIVALFGSIGGIKIPDMFVSMKKDKNVQLFNQHLIKALRRMSSTLNASGTIKQAIQDVVNARSIPPTIRIEFEQVLSDINYGDTAEQALYKLYDRTGSDDVKFMAMSVEVQRQAGGNMAETFENISKTISNRFLLESEVKATLSQAQASSTLLSIMPFFIFGGLMVMNPTHFDVMRESLLGNVLMGVLLGMMVFGTFIVRKISKIKM